MNFSQRFTDLLEEEMTTAKQLGVKLGIDHTSIYLYLQGSIPNVKNAVKLANYYNCTLNYLFGLDYYPNEYTFFKTYNSTLFFERYTGLLKLRKVSHYKICKDCGIGNSSFIRWKDGREPKLETLIKISDYLKCNIDYLIGRSNDL